MKTQILGGSYVARSTNAADNRMVNLFPEATPEGGKEAGFLSRCPGLSLLTTLGVGPVRGMWVFGGYSYVVSGSNLYRVDNSWGSQFIGSVSGSGPVSMADNGTQLFIAANPDGYIYNAFTGNFDQISDPDFPGAVTVGYLDGYFVFNEPNSQKIWITSLYEGTQIDALEFASAEGSPDDLVAISIDHREAWVFGTNSIEVWYDAGTADFPLQRIQGAFIEIGCAAPYSVAKLDNSLFWLGSDARGNGIIYRSSGYQGKRVSTHAIEYAIAQYGNISGAIGYTYQQEGHAFYVLSFAQATWVFDVATQAWHERAGFNNGQLTRHWSNCQMNYNNEIVVGDYRNGNIYAFDLDVYSDDNEIQKWIRSWRALATGQNNLNRTTQHALQLDCEVGNIYPAFDESPLFLTAQNDYYLITESEVYLIDDAGVRTPSSSEVLLRWSDDGGHTWSNYHAKSMGATGETGKRVFWRRLGMTLKLRDRVYEISGTDPVKIAIMGAELHVSATDA
jgi:hypothetical protein